MKGVLIFVISVFLLSAGSRISAETLYSPDAGHIWNRLYAGLFVRKDTDGKDCDDLTDPPFWPHTKFLLEEESRTRALALLHEFSSKSAQRDEMSDLQRAVMQRDLIAVFFWLTWPELRNEKRPATPQEQELAMALARAIRHVALPETAVRKLPDNYASAVEAKTAPVAFDVMRPGQAFLPPDLLDENGPWVPVAESGANPVSARLHFKAFQSRSAFEVRLWHPKGRGAAETYLRELGAMTDPALAEQPATNLRSRTLSTAYGWLNPATPQFPTNSAWALVRRAILFSAEGVPVVSPLVESIQFRVYREIDWDASKSQTVFQWELRRRDLFTHKGFHESQPGEDRSPHFMGKGFDPFEEPALFSKASKAETLGCFECHSGAGIHSVISRTKLFDAGSSPARLEVTAKSRVTRTAEQHARVSAEWTLLRWMAAGR